MKSPVPHDDSPDAGLDERDPLWHVLGCAPRSEPDAWFVARTLARCRNEIPAAETGGMTLARMWRWAIGGGLALCLAALLVVTQVTAPAPTESTVPQKNVQEAFEIVASVGTDSDSSPSTSSSWQDSSL